MADRPPPARTRAAAPSTPAAPTSATSSRTGPFTPSPSPSPSSASLASLAAHSRQASYSAARGMYVSAAMSMAASQNLPAVLNDPGKGMLIPFSAMSSFPNHFTLQESSATFSPAAGVTPSRRRGRSLRPQPFATSLQTASTGTWVNLVFRVNSTLTFFLGQVPEETPPSPPTPRRRRSSPYLVYLCFPRR